jgi:hypothetical protein
MRFVALFIAVMLTCSASTRLKAWMCAVDVRNSITRNADRLRPQCEGGKCVLPQPPYKERKRGKRNTKGHRAVDKKARP